MAKGRKRKRSDNDASQREENGPPTPDTPVRRDLLSRYYTHVTSLRAYLLDKLPASSRLRRKKIASLGFGEQCTALDKQLAYLLDHAIVGTSETQAPSDPTRWEQWLAFSQQPDDSTVTLANGLNGSHFSQAELVDFTIWLLFSREQKPKHLLCDGFTRTTFKENKAPSTIPGLCELSPNSRVLTLNQAPWPQLLKLLGRSGQKLMLGLLIDCSIFLPVQAGFQNYSQLSG